MDAPAFRRAQVLVVVAQMPHQIGRGIAGHRPVVGHACDPAQRVVAVIAPGVHLADDRVLGAGHPGQRRQRSAHPVAAVVAAHRVQRFWRVRDSQFGCLGEQFDDVVEPAVVHRRGVEMHQITDRQPVGDVEAHGAGGWPLLLRMSRRHSLRV